MRSRLAALPRSVWILGLISLVNDGASDLIYPLLPLISLRCCWRARGRWA